MIRRLAQNAALVAVLALALVATGFGHRAPSLQDQAIEAYILAGFDLGDLCGEGDGPSAHDGTCMACQITAGADLVPTLGAQSWAAVWTAGQDLPKAADTRDVPVRLRGPANGLRAPPTA